jgi:hypothetical protein
LPAVYTYSYTEASTIIAGASCASGYSGTPRYTCNATSVGSTTPPTLGGCYANCSATLANATVNSYQHGGTATCNSGYSSSLGNTNPNLTCNNGLWDGVCYKKCNGLNYAYGYNPSGQTLNYNHGTSAFCNDFDYYSTTRSIICQNGLWYLDNNRNGIINTGETTQINSCSHIR